MIGSLVCSVEWELSFIFFKGDFQVSNGKSFSDLINTAIQMGAQVFEWDKCRCGLPVLRL